MPKIDLDVENASASDLGTALLKAFELSSIVVQDKPNVECLVNVSKPSLGIPVIRESILSEKLVSSTIVHDMNVL
jgi:hypothetical protein